MALRDELEFDELEPPPPPPPPEELLDDEPWDDEDDCDDELDEDDLDEDELDEGALDVELEDDELEGALLLELPLESGEDEVLDPPVLPSGPVGDVPHPTPNMPTPARATPPDSILRNCRRSSRRVASSTGCDFSDWLMRPPSHWPIEQAMCQVKKESVQARRGQSGGSAPPS